MVVFNTVVNSPIFDHSLVSEFTFHASDPRVVKVVVVLTPIIEAAVMRFNFERVVLFVARSNWFFVDLIFVDSSCSVDVLVEENHAFGFREVDLFKGLLGTFGAAFSNLEVLVLVFSESYGLDLAEIR